LGGEGQIEIAGLPFGPTAACHDTLVAVSQPFSSSLSAAAPWWHPNPGRCLAIEGGRSLVGTYPISGAKNAVLPLMVSTLLTPHLVTLNNVPANLDVAVLATLLKSLGAGLHWSRTDIGLSVMICADHVHPVEIDRELVARMRASVLLLGALLARCGEASLPMPGGDAIGLRGIDFHVAGLRAMGAEIEVSGGTIRATARSGLRGADILLPQPSVGATENLLLAAALARGTTFIRNAAREPEIADLAACLAMMGAMISGIGTDVLTIVGGTPLSGAIHGVMPDRIELGTLACAAAITDGELMLKHGRLDLLGAAAPLLKAAGVDLCQVELGVVARRSVVGLIGVDIVTRPHPGFATDLQAPAMALLSTAAGASMLTETIFEQRFWHVDELRKMGANITVRGQTALVRGVPTLRGASVTGTDVRAAAALVIAGLGAAGETILDGLEHLDRGYDRMVEKLVCCGAHVRRLEG
jgi:UDP-N-acetylglucosamine 1-carboxyvinyltransferase